VSLERLQRAADALGDSPEGEFLATAVRRLLAGLDADRALELRGTGAERARNRLINEAAALLDGRPTRRAKILASAIARLPRHRQQGNVLMDTLAAADRCAPLPKSWRQLYSILATATEEPSTARKAS
jgi:hypothetical protein